MKHLAAAIIGLTLISPACSGDDTSAPEQLPSQTVMIARAEYVDRLDGVGGAGCVVGQVAESLSADEFLDGLDADHLDDAPTTFVTAVTDAAETCGVSIDRLRSYPALP